MDLPEEWYRYIIFQLAADLAPEYSRSLDERQWLTMAAQQALMVATRSQGQYRTKYEPRNQGLSFLSPMPGGAVGTMDQGG